MINVSDPTLGRRRVQTALETLIFYHNSSLYTFLSLKIDKRPKTQAAILSFAPADASACLSISSRLALAALIPCCFGLGSAAS